MLHLRVLCSARQVCWQAAAACLPLFGRLVRPHKFLKAWTCGVVCYKAGQVVYRQPVLQAEATNVVAPAVADVLPFWMILV